MTREPSQRSPVTAEARVPHVTSCARIPYAFFTSGLPNRYGKLICPSTRELVAPSAVLDPQAAGCDCHSLKAKWLARLGAREPDHLRDVQIELSRYGQTGESLRGRLLAAATPPLAPLMPLDSFPIAIGRRV
jgi:hypothetical protein